MNFTIRLRKILRILLEQDQAMPVQELADRIGVSKRTVQRELEYIDKDLASYHLSFHTKTGKGVWILGKAEDKQKLLDELREGDDYDAANKEDRRKRLVLEILKDKGLKKLFYYANMFQVSEATVSSDLEAIEGWLNAHSLTIIRKPGSGVEIQGTENNYRRAIRAFIDENIDTQVLRDSYEEGKGVRAIRNMYGSSIGRIFKEDVLSRVVKCISGMEDKRVSSMTANSYAGLVLHVSIAISRILKQEFVETSQDLYEQMAKDEDFALAERIVEKLEEEFQVAIPKIEKAYICLHIKGAKYQNVEWNGRKSVAVERRELLDLINEMIEVFSPDQAFLYKQDSEFVQALMAHLQPTFIRLLYDMKISNPVLEEIKVSYPDIFAQCSKAAKVIEKWTGKAVPEEEIGFLTIHFGAATVRLEGKTENIRRVQIGIICASGIGISRLMLSKLEKIFRDRIQMETYGHNDITPYVIGKTDFFVCSIPMQDASAEFIQVSPLLTEKDIDEIGSRIYHYERLPKKSQEETVFTAELEQINVLAMQIKTIIRYLEVFKMSPDITFGELTEAISEKMSPYGDRRVMIQEAIEEREKLGSQVFAEFGFALLHTRTKGVTRPSFSVCLTRDGDAFRNPYFQGVHVVLVMLLPVDENLKINSEILGYISSELIEDYNFLMTISEGDKSKIESALSDTLKRFFNQYLNKFQD